MDPRITVVLFLQAAVDRDVDAMREHAENLAAWIERQGFIPANLMRALEAAEGDPSYQRSATEGA